jgi:hypothetical protein
MYVSSDFRTEGSSTERVDAHRLTARRVLRDLFGLEEQDVGLTDATTLSDFAKLALNGTATSSSARAWAIGVKEQVYAHYGIDCEVDEPFVDLLVRLESAEHGVRLTRQK